MSTRSCIAKDNGFGIFDAIYCHFDGDFNGVGKTLAEHYTDAKKVDELINLGSLSSLGENFTAPKGVEHSFEKPCDGVTVAYHRDRDEGTTPTISRNIISLIGLKKEAKGMGAEYLYVFRNNKWYWCKGRALHPLPPVK